MLLMQFIVTTVLSGTVNIKRVKRGEIVIILHNNGKGKYKQPHISYYDGLTVSSASSDKENADIDTLKAFSSIATTEINYRNYNRKDYFFIANIGDTIEIKERKGVPYITSTRQNQKALDYRWLQEFGKNNRDYHTNFKKDIKTLTTKKKIKRYFDLYKRKIGYIKNLYTEGELSEEVYKTSLSRLKFDRDRMLSEKSVTGIYNGKVIDKKSLLSDSLLIHSTYKGFIVDYSFSLAMPDAYKKRAFSDYRKIFDWCISDNTFPKKSYDFLLAHSLFGIRIFFPSEDFLSRIDKAYDAFSDDRYRKTFDGIKADLQKKLKRDDNDMVLLNNRGEKINFMNLLKANRGKVIYVDLWASWCAPCCKAIPSSHKLREYYKGKDVTFVYLAWNDKTEQWTKRSTELGLDIYKDNYFIIKSSNNLTNLGIRAIPRYLIIDKAGKIAEENAPGPKDKEVKKIIDKYLAR